MLVDALIRSVELQGSGDKAFAVLTIETEQPLEIMQIRLFNSFIQSGVVKQLQSVVGKAIKLPVKVDVYKGSIQYQMPFDVKLHLPQQAKAS